MVMIPAAGQFDGDIFDEFMAEVSGLLEEQVTVERYSSTTGGNELDGEAPTKLYDTFLTMALIEALTAQELAESTGFYQMGDVKAQFRLQVYGSEGGINSQASSGDQQAAGRYSDVITFRGRKYKILGHPNRIHYGGQYYWDTVLRQAQTG